MSHGSSAFRQKDSLPASQGNSTEQKPHTWDLPSMHRPYSPIPQKSPMEQTNGPRVKLNHTEVQEHYSGVISQFPFVCQPPPHRVAVQGVSAEGGPWGGGRAKEKLQESCLQVSNSEKKETKLCKVNMHRMSVPLVPLVKADAAHGRSISRKMQQKPGCLNRPLVPYSSSHHLKAQDSRYILILYRSLLKQQRLGEGWRKYRNSQM